MVGDLRAGNLDSLKGIQNIWPYVIDNYLANQFVQILGGETDEPVTADIRRLIRCPTSLHGGSGFRVTPLSISSLEEFEPLWDAIVFGDEPVQIDMQKPFNTEIRGHDFNLGEGPSELPAYAAIFLMARGLAELGAKL